MVALGSGPVLQLGDPRRRMDEATLVFAPPGLSLTSTRGWSPTPPDHIDQSAGAAASGW